MQRIVFCLFLLGSCNASMAAQLFMAGDSTMSTKASKDYPETGWGEPFSHFFSEDLAIVNLAKNGRSTKTFIADGLWQQIINDVQKGDFVIIQFGHNDASEHKKDRYTTPEQYRENLIMMIEQTREKQAQPLLLSSITRRYFNGDGTMKHTHPYTHIVKSVAELTKVDFIDMETISRTYFQHMGDKDSSLRFMHIKPDLHPNYPNGIKDDTHFNSMGAREIAQLVLQQLRTIDHPLLSYLREPDPKHLTYSYY